MDANRASLLVRNAEGMLPLHVLVDQQSASDSRPCPPKHLLESVHLLLGREKSAARVRDKEGNLPLKLALRSSWLCPPEIQVGVVEALLDEFPNVVQERNHDMLSLLATACESDVNLCVLHTLVRRLLPSSSMLGPSREGGFKSAAWLEQQQQTSTANSNRLCHHQD